MDDGTHHVIGLFTTDPAGRIVEADAPTATILAPGGSVLGRAPWWAADPSRRVEIEGDFARSRNGGSRLDTSFVVSVDDTPRAVRVVLSPRLAGDGSSIGYTGVALVDTVDRGDALSRVVHRTTDLVLVVDGDGTVAFANDAVRNLVGDSQVGRVAAAVREQGPRALLGPDDLAPDHWRGDVTVRDVHGDTRTLDCTVVRGEVGSSAITAWCRDITPLVRLNAELAHQATHDALTGLPNRQLFLRRVAEAVERARVDGHGPAVLYVDIDHLKNVNDSLGHESGDTFITTVGRRLSAVTRPGDVVGRIGGDEFVVLCVGVGDDVTALDLAERIRAAVTEPVIVSGTRISSGASIGASVWRPTDDAGAAIDAALELVHRADTAMYRAKARGKGRCEVFGAAMLDDARRRSRLADELERALAEDRLHLVFQSIVATHTSRVDGAEALLRWEHPTEGVLTPVTFLDLAEESGLVVPIGRWVVDQTIGHLASWIADGRVDRRFRVHLNVSPRQVADVDFVENLMSTLRRHGVAPANVCIEYGVAALDDDEAIRTLQSLGRLGFLLLIDDFGDSHSSLRHLRACRSHFVKLHGSFVGPLGEDDREDPLVCGVIQLAHGLDMSVVASWVGSAEQLERLRALGCDHVQGFHVARPVRAEDFDPAAVARFSD